jgi:hypothetical protein
MNELDVADFNKAIALAGNGEKETAHRTLAKLRNIYPNNVNLLMWYAFTAAQLSEARSSLELAGRYEPQNPNLPAAFQWLEGEENKKRLEGSIPPDFAELSRQEAASEVYGLPLLPDVKFKQLNPNLQALAARYLKSGEQVIWCGQPVVSAYLWKKQSRAIYMALVWVVALVLAIVLSLLYLETNSGYSFFAILSRLRYTAIILVPGLGLLWLLYNTYQEAQTHLYLLTEQRALVLQGGRTTEPYKEFLPEYRIPLEIVRRPEGNGDLLFTTETHIGENSEVRERKTGFFFIKEIDLAARLVSQIFFKT